MRLAQSGSGTVRSPVGRTRRWVTAWLIGAALLAVLLLANSVRDYLLVWRILATQQVRHQMGRYVAVLELLVVVRRVVETVLEHDLTPRAASARATS